MAKKYVYRFSKDLVEGDKDQRNLLGGKGANLHEMCRLGLPVPPGFTITTEACVHTMQHKVWPEGLEEQVRSAVAWLEEATGKGLGRPENPLLVSVRSGARASMPGMMDTVLNLGLNETTLEGLARLTGNRRFALDSYRRFVKMFGDVVLGLKAEKGEEDPFETILEDVKKRSGKHQDTELDERELEEIVRREKDYVARKTGKPFPTDPWQQLMLAIDAVFASWMNDRAIEYRRIYRIPEDWGTAVNVQTMVFGNMGEDSGTGVCFTRDPGTGENVFTGEFLMNAQGEDVVAGIRTPNKVQELEGILPESYRDLVATKAVLEKHYGWMQDLEFTIERKHLYFLQCRDGKSTPLAAIRIGIEMLDEGLTTERKFLEHVEADGVTYLLRPIFHREARKQAVKEGRLVAKGLNAGPGAASGRVVFFSDEMDARRSEWATTDSHGKKVPGKTILVRIETSPEDIKGMEKAEGILTARGGMTSHAALVARQRGKVCVAGCSDIEVDYGARQMRIGPHLVREGDWISLDGSTGEVFLGAIETAPSEVLQVLKDHTLRPEEAPDYQRFARLMALADKYRRLGVRTNADSPAEAALAVAFGAQGIGLCRTEHMFFEGDRITSMRKMIMAETEEERRRALEELLPLQRSDFHGIFLAMEGRPVTIRTLDPPLHEFLPQGEEKQREFSQKTGISMERIQRRVEELHEFNPMLGHRGCRLGITYPEITEMQARAILEAACDVRKEGKEVHPEIMIPLVGHVNELRHQERIVRETAEKVFAEKGIRVDYLVGTMIEVPRAAVMADQIAEAAEFFSFGTNDLTQMGFGMSRDDYGKFMPIYLSNEKGILKVDPFVSLDDGIAELVRLAVERGRKTRPNIKLGICGEHGGEPHSITKCHRIGLNYVSCSPYRVPVARVAAAQAALADLPDA
ncbi:MAG TPA: pyruvate, phosphate dikinase [Myxococcota bacterium]|nr:pyruvate, phosphate dikinase [Myxococcota bacterium]HQK50270.1 pyruvate, phosphate dikinase [Myxococcota bacterium]